VRTLGFGDSFGEIALIKKSKRSLAVRAKGACVLLTLDQEAFTRVLGSIEEHLKMDYGNTAPAPKDD
jgi:CRP-like cAMP-binding protein